MIALVAGATGLVGGHIVRLLADQPGYERILVVARRPVVDPPPRVDVLLLDFDTLQDHEQDLVADHIFCALGTTRKAAGSRDRFRQVDLEYPRRLARITRQNGARHFSLISAIGANPRSLFFYNRVKGQAEAAVRQPGFPSGAILRPSVLGGAREEPRPAERVAQKAMRLAPARWRTIHAADVARAAIRLAAAEEPGWRIVESREIHQLGR
jgi:uncharacterized protein YbjT (DUF2867 family)